MDEAQIKRRFLKVLAVSSDASANELRAAYEIQAKKWRTDCLEHNPELQAMANQKLVEIRDAFECLSEPEKLRKYMLRTTSEKSVAENAVRRAIADKTAAQAAISKAIANQSTAEKNLRKAEAAKVAAEKAVDKALQQKVASENLVQKARAEKLATETAVKKAIDEKSNIDGTSSDAAARLLAVDPGNKALVALHAAGKERKDFSALIPVKHRIVWLGGWTRDLLVAVIVIATPFVLYALASTHLAGTPMRIHLHGPTGGTVNPRYRP